MDVFVRISILWKFAQHECNFLHRSLVWTFVIIFHFRCTKYVTIHLICNRSGHATGLQWALGQGQDSFKDIMQIGFVVLSNGWPRKT